MPTLCIPASLDEICTFSRRMPRNPAACLSNQSSGSFYALLFVFIILQPVPLLQAQTASASTGTSGQSARPIDNYQDQTWCTLPPSSPADFLLRQRQESTALKTKAEHRERERDPGSITKLRNLQVAMEGGQQPNDAIIQGHLLHFTSSSEVATVPVTYKITRDGNEKIITNFASRTTTFVARGSVTAMTNGTRNVPLSPAFSEDHQILVLPQWSNLRHHTDGNYGVKSYIAVDGLDVTEVLPPERFRSQVERVVPRTGTCIASDPATQLVRRIEIVLRAENRLTRVHRRSVEYSDYRQVNGVQVPLKQRRYLDGVLQDTLVVDAVTFNAGLKPSDFTWSAQ